MPADTPSRPFRIADLARRGPQAFRIEPAVDERAALAAELGISEVRKLRFEGSLVPEGNRDWRLEARLGATVVQPCVVTLAPVVTRIDETVTRRYLARMPAPEAEPGSEVEMPVDVETEPLGHEIDPAQVMAEALALALPDYPRAPGAALEQAVYAEPGVEPLTDAAAHPFAALKHLKPGNDR